MRGLTIENLVTEDNTKMESFARDILKMLSGGNSYVDGNGYLIEKGTFNHAVMVLAPLFPQPSLMSQILPLLLTSHGTAANSESIYTISTAATVPPCPPECWMPCPQGARYQAPQNPRYRGPQST